jgi:hypothetical protein
VLRFDALRPLEPKPRVLQVDGFFAVTKRIALGSRFASRTSDVCRGRFAFAFGSPILRGHQAFGQSPQAIQRTVSALVQ